MRYFASLLADYLAIWLSLYKNIAELLGRAAHIEARKAEICNRTNASHRLHFMGSFRRLRFLGCVSRLDPTTYTLWAFASCADLTGRTSRAFVSLTHCMGPLHS